jgi:hypothetical protein
MKKYTKPAFTRLSWREGSARYQAAALFQSAWYRHSFAPGEVWDDDEE